LDNNDGSQRVPSKLDFAKDQDSGTKGAAMKIIGCDFHPSFQQIAMVDTETGEHTEKRLTPSEAVQFYGQLKGQVVIGMEGCGKLRPSGNLFKALFGPFPVESWRF
jgi:hypothetical protein